MKKRFSLTALLLALLMVVSMLAACNETTSTGDSSEGDGSKSETSGDVRYETDLPEFTWDIKTGTYGTFDVLVYNDKVQTTYFSEEIGFDMYDTTDEVLNDAVMERNNYVKEQTGVEVKAHAVDDVNSTLRDALTSGSQDYDMAMPFMSAAAKLAQEGVLLALNDDRFADYLHLDEPWWDQSANDSLSVDGKLYFTTGDISIMQKIVSVAMTFNKDLFAELNQGVDLYEIVKDGEWTMDKLVEYSKKAMLCEDGTWDMNDRWGCIGAYNDANMFYMASGNQLCGKDAEDLPILMLDQESSINAGIKIVEYLIAENEWVLHTEKMQGMGSTAIWVDSLAVFGNNKALFRTSAFSAIKKLRQYDAKFGIVPMPKLDASQDTYYTPCSSNYAYGVVIPQCAPDAEFSAYMTELLCCEAKNGITDAYYETTLKSRDMKDEDSEEMLDDYVFSNVVYDTGYVYNFGSIQNILKDRVTSGSTDIASSLEAVKGTIQGDIDKTVEYFRD